LIRFIRQSNAIGEIDTSDITKLVIVQDKDADETVDSLTPALEKLFKDYDE